MSDEKTKRPWWKSGWLLGLVILAGLHASGMAVHVQATLQRVVLATGILRPSVVPEADRPAVDLSFLYGDQSRSVHTAADLQGDVIFINVWATWCAPCLAEMPAIDKLYRSVGDDVQFLMLSVDDDFGKAQAFVESKDFAFPIVRAASRLPDWLDTGVIPTTVVVDRAGRIAVREAGMALYNSERFKAQLKVLVRESGDASAPGTP